MDNRICYDEIKRDFLACYFAYCRSHIRRNEGWCNGEYEVTHAYDEFVYMEKNKYTAYARNIENLMLEVTALILEANRLPKMAQYHRKMISKLLEKDNLSREINDLPENERLDFISDLELLNISIPGIRK